MNAHSLIAHASRPVNDLTCETRRYLRGSRPGPFRCGEGFAAMTGY
jgi:hypothetical protein